jgi:hypothetical protein
VFPDAVGQKKTYQTMLRIDSEAAELLSRAADATHLQPAALVRAATLAMLDSFRTHGRIEFPLRLEEPGSPYQTAAEKPPDKNSRTRGTGPDHRVSKSA